MSYARIVLAAFDVDLAGVEVLYLLQARTQALGQGHENHVVVEMIEALLVLGAVDGAQVDLDADAGEVFGIGLQNTFEVRVDQQNFKTQGFALAIDQGLSGWFPAGLAKQAQGPAQGFPRDASALGLR